MFPLIPRRLAATASVCNRPVHRYRHIMNASSQPVDTSFPAEVDDLLTAVVRDGFTLRYCNGLALPTLVIGTYDWGAYVDLVVIRAIDDVVSARIPTAEVADIFAPEVMVWLYAGGAERALKALLDLPHPTHPEAPTTPVPAPAALQIPAAREAPVTVRPPSALAAQARQLRLGAALCRHAPRGYGGLDLATIAAFGPGSRISWVSETDSHMNVLLAERSPTSTNIGDVNDVDWRSIPGVNVLTAGFPCQDISAAGKREGIKKGNRSGLFYQVLAAVRALRPEYVFLENVAALRWKDGGLAEVLAHLAEARYDALWTSVRASDVGAPHRRERVFPRLPKLARSLAAP